MLKDHREVGIKFLIHIKEGNEKYGGGERRHKKLKKKNQDLVSTTTTTRLCCAASKKKEKMVKGKVRRRQRKRERTMRERVEVCMSHIVRKAEERKPKRSTPRRHI